ncbi:DUF1168-domain-containing protein [Pluteus cervinus]|uniref:DUF1168-domain-containing protein n=1 Tax=Pluteus cervinus TaxID=181527 RepID=A0ACD3BAY6_9AGAR|nr:DUF1168-domain-containing protein [Pluteus cervinus]
MASSSNSSTPTPGPSTTSPANRHALTPVEKQRGQLERLLKDPTKPVFIPAPPKAKTVRAAREMMKNVQGSSAGAGSGEFHVYKASRRREYERLKLLEEEVTKETTEAEFARKRREADEVADAKTAKNRAKRQKKKERAKNKSGGREGGNGSGGEGVAQVLPDAPIKKRRLINGKELVFRRPGQDDDDEGEEQDEQAPQSADDTGHTRKGEIVEDER